MDDIRTDHVASSTEREPDQPPESGETPIRPVRKVGPESEVRGGPEANKKPLPPKAGGA